MAAALALAALLALAPRAGATPAGSDTAGVGPASGSARVSAPAAASDSAAAHPAGASAAVVDSAAVRARVPAAIDSAGARAPAAPAPAGGATEMNARARALLAADSTRGDFPPADTTRAGGRAPSAADSARAATADTTRGTVPADTSGAAGRPRSRDRIRLTIGRTRYFDQPRWVMFRSLVVPGWGQLHNGSWLKAVAFAAGEGVIGVRLLGDLHELKVLDGEVSAAFASGDIASENEVIARYNARLDQSVRREWLLAGIVTYALLDAYVDAHFRNFKIEFEGDPALPGGRSRGGARLSVRWGF